MGKKRILNQSVGHSDEFMTPHYAVDILTPYLNPEWVIIECAWGKGDMAKALKERGFQVIGYKAFNFFKDTPTDSYDIIVTNPPYSSKNLFLQRAYEIEKPFAFLLPLTALEGKFRGSLYRKYGIQLIIPNKRINFITPSGKGSGAWFQVAWFCWGLDLPQQLNFVEARW